MTLLDCQLVRGVRSSLAQTSVTGTGKPESIYVEIKTRKQNRGELTRPLVARVHCVKIVQTEGARHSGMIKNPAIEDMRRCC